MAAIAPTLHCRVYLYHLEFTLCQVVTAPTVQLTPQ